MYLVSVLSFPFTWTHVGFHECFLAGRFSRGAGPVRGLNVRVPPALVSCLELESNTLFICSGELQKVPELWWKGRYWAGTWRDKLVKQNSQSSPLGNRVAESMQAGAPEAFTTMWMLAHILLNEKSQPCSELQGYNSTLRIWWLQKPPELCCPGLTAVCSWRQF